MPLTDVQIKRLKPEEKDHFVLDEKWLFLLAGKMKQMILISFCV